VFLKATLLDECPFMERLTGFRVGPTLSTMEASMTRTLLGITAAAFLLASPAFAQNMNTGNTSTPGIGVSKDDQTYQKTTKSKKHATRHTKRKHSASNTKPHNGKPMNSKPQTTGSGSSSMPGAGVNKDDTAPKR
jgi:hypothetical protein